MVNVNRYCNPRFILSRKPKFFFACIEKFDEIVDYAQEILNFQESQLVY